MLNNNYKISVIVPAYNIAEYLPRCLDSILKQTYKNLEVIVISDGSTDGTNDVIKKYAEKDNRIVAIFKENSGVSDTRNKGIDIATGDYIGFVDGDDYIEPNMYETLLNNAIENDADISHCGYQMNFPDGHTIFYYNTGRLAKQDNATGLKDLLTGSFIEPGLWNKLFHKSLFHSLLHNDAVPSDIKINEDLLMNYWLFKGANKSVYFDFCPYHYVLRRNSAATSNVNYNKLWDPIKVRKIILNDASEELKPVVQSSLIRLLINGATIDIKQNPDLIKPYRTQMRKELRGQLRMVMKDKNFVLSLKVMALWASLLPKSYAWIHKLYAKFTGTDKIYDLG